MTEAEKLLQETKSAAVVAESQAEDICVIDSDLRIIGIPEQFKVLGVEHDKDVKVIQFRIPKVYKGTDLSAFTISVNYQNARGTKDRYVVTDKKVSGDQIEFSWTVGKTAIEYRGDTRFIVCMRLTGSDGIIQKEFNTTLATMTVLEGLEVDNPVIEQEEKDIIAQLLQIVDDKSKEVVQAVTAEGTKQIKAVQDAAQEVIADREQIKTNKADIADLRQMKAGAIINSAKGERIAVGDSADAFFEGLKLHGKSEQNGSPTPDNPIPIKSCGDGGAIGIRVLRKNLCKVTSVLNASFDENTGTLVNNAKNNTVKSYVKIQKYKGDKFLEEIPVSNTGKTEKIFSINGTFNRIRLAFAGDRSEGNISIDVSYLNYGEYTLSMDIEEIGMNEGRISKIMLLNKGESDETFEPFQYQQASLSTPNGLPGLPVDSGGNYTDSNGQQWICDEMDFKRGKYVQRVKKVVFNGSEDWNLESISQKGFANFYVRNLSGIRANSNVLSNQFRNQTTVISETTEEGIANLSTLYVRIDKTKADNANKFKEILKTNNLEICYQLATPIETDIPEETMTAYRNLYTNYPSTVIQNDSGAGMEVEYVADTKQFILDQIKALVQA
jgi:hypothetical protein